MTQRDAWILQTAAQCMSGFMAAHEENVYITDRRKYAQDFLLWAKALVDESGVVFDDEIYNKESHADHHL